MFKGWKTFVFGFLVAISGVGLDYIANFDWTKTDLAPWIVSGIGIAVMALRAVTNTSLFKQD